MPLQDEELVVEPSFPNAQHLAKIGLVSAPEQDPAEHKVKHRNTFYLSRRRVWISTFDQPNGKVGHCIAEVGVHHFGVDLRTLGCSDAWGIEQESNAMQLLGTHVSHRQFKHYLLTGMFLETSKRSGVTYVFRRLKPTVALHAVDGESRILCALCMHPIAYYKGTWAGAMCPTDDVVAHLMLMRGDEAMFWRRCTQHQAWSSLAGL